MPSNMIWIPNVFCYNRYGTLLTTLLSVFSIDVHRMDTEKDSNEVLVRTANKRFAESCFSDYSRWERDPPDEGSI